MVMNTTELTYLLQHPGKINPSQLSEIQALINKYPYFQAGRAVYLKVLKQKGSFKYNQELKSTAAYSTDRSVLFDYITSEVFLQNEISKHIQQNIEHLKDIDVNIEDISVQKSVIIDDALKQQIKDSEPLLDPDLFKVKPTPSNHVIEVDGSHIETKMVEPLLSPETKLQIGKPFEFNKNEIHSFGEWLKITSFKPIIRDENTEITFTEVEKPITEKLELIDKFIASNPKIAPVKKDSKPINLSISTKSEPDSLMTETLARIYLEQKNYKKAIQSYKILSLKYPEKSSFFANQIQAIKELQE